LPKAHALTVEQAAVEVENYNASRGELLTWPTLETRSGQKELNVSQFQKDYVDIIPENWTALSMSLNEDRDELYVTRYRAHESPFILRLPLARHQSRDLDEDAFGFDDGKAELIEIIDLSDFSSHSGKDMNAKGAKTEWWAEREALDNRLRDLLVNIENIWLGGFRGVFSQHTRQPSLLARFQKSFQNILDRHLPSRRGRSKAKQNKIQLDPRILELFVGLGDATNDQLELDEPLMDLVYFVVDVLQFSGEKNAYDEIDFDAIVVETQDALQAYHAASHKDAGGDHHTILILDKSLHCFPWESLPSLQGQSISRLPSLAALRERLMSAKRPSQAGRGEAWEPGHYVSAQGTSILNPSGDLSHTQRALQPCLKELKGDWQHIVARPPTEEEFERTLKGRDLLLYFGHGSGAQYIRSRTIKRLYVSNGAAATLKPSSASSAPGREAAAGNGAKCSTTWLMGCSSAAVTEHGTFEPSGTVCSYMTAGAPAVLGMLWDVTDKDCDRFSVRCGELWGLWDEATATAALNAAKKGKKVAADAGRVRKQVARLEGEKAADREGNQKQERVSLDQAVARSRDACYLRYLNGAAAVVYGIPVFLD
jgi:separase